jgi:hypothetical protein
MVLHAHGVRVCSLLAARSHRLVQIASLHDDGVEGYLNPKIVFQLWGQPSVRMLFIYGAIAERYQEVCSSCSQDVGEFNDTHFGEWIESIRLPRERNIAEDSCT